MSCATSAPRSAGLERHLTYVLGECVRLDRALLDLWMTTLPTGATPDRTMARQIEAERKRARAFALRLERRAERIRGDR